MPGGKSGWGQRGSAVRPSVAVQGQTYKDVHASCLNQGALWEDPEFPASDESVFFSRRANFEWKRPTEIVADPKMFVGGASRFDIRQGELGDCWLLAAVASLTCNQKLLERVVPTDQNFTDNYSGCFRFCFWQYGEWTDILIDDRLPTRNGKLVFLHSASQNEFWSALLEKAYAKLAGSYEALKGGSQAEAMEDFTGGLTERIDLKNAPKNLFTMMLKGHKLGSLMGCAVDAGPNQIEAAMDNGLVMGHAYSVTSVALVDINVRGRAGQMQLLRIRNPWGNEKEWTGAWSDKSREWNLLSEEEKEEHGITFSDDGEFWMSFKDFLANFTTLEMCSLGPDSMTGGMEEKGRNAWSASSEPGQWKAKVCAGGCRNFLDTFWTNPQYHITVTDPDDDDDDNLCTVVVGLMQKNRRKLRKEGLDLLTMGYAIYQLKDPELAKQGQLEMDFFKYNASFARSPSFINMREVCGRHQLPPGSYVIVPSSFNPNEEADFLMRIFSEKPNKTESVDEETHFSEKQEKPQTNGDKVATPPMEEAATEKFRQLFAKISGEDMEMDAYELRDVLNQIYKGGTEFPFDGFSIETCRSMVAMKDLDHSGKLGFEEFCQLYSDLKMWKGVFKKYDADKSGTFNSYELRQALRMSGFRVSNATFNALVMRFANKQGQIEFDDFVLCAVRLRAMFDSFGAHATSDGSKASFTLDEFVQNGLYA